MSSSTRGRSRMAQGLGGAAICAMAGLAGTARAAAPVLEVGTAGSSITVDFSLPPSSVALAQGAESWAGKAPEVEGLSRSGAPGQPDLPTFGMFLALPPGTAGSARLAIEQASFHDVQGIGVDPPATTRIPPPDGEDPGDGLVEPPAFAAVPDPAIYGRDAYFPDAAAAIALHGVVRDVDFVKIEINPLRWNPVTRTLRVHDRIRFRLEVSACTEAPGAAGEAAGRTRDRGGASAGRFASETHARAERGALGGLFANSVPPSWHVRRPALAGVCDVTNPAASGEAWKVPVSADGIHRVSFESLQAEGFPAAPAPFDELKLEMRGQAVPVAAIDADRDGRFGPGDAIEFFGLANRERWSATNVHWITRGGGGAAMHEVAALPPGAGSWPNVTATLATSRAEQNEVVFAYSAVDPSQWAPWVFKTSLITGAPVGCGGRTPPLEVDLEVPHLGTLPAGATARLRGRFVGRTVGTCNPPEQEIDVDLNGTALGNVTWDTSLEGQLKEWTLDVDPALLVEGTNRVTLTQPYLSAKLRWSHLDYLELEYPRLPIAESRTLELRGEWPAGAVFYVRGVGSTRVEVIDVRGDGRVDRLVGVRSSSLGPGQPPTTVFALAPEAGVSHRVVVSAVDAILRPAVAKDAPSDLRAAAAGAGYVAISHPSFLAATQELLDYRAGRGLTTKLVDVQDVYDEFSYGNVDAHAIRDFLACALAGWSEPPLYVLLVGDSTVDFRNYWGAAQSPFFLPHLEQVSLASGAAFGETVDGDSFYQTLVGSDPVPDLLLGRIPAQTPADVTGYLDKVRVHEGSPGTEAWNRRVLTIIDDNMETGNDSDCPASPSPIEEVVVRKTDCYLSSAGPNPDDVRLIERTYGWPEGRDVILQEINQGISVMLYYGHGAQENFGLKCPNRTAGIHAMFQNSDVPALTNSPAAAFASSLSCNVASFEFFNATLDRSRAIAESLVLAPDHGFAAFVGSTTTIGELEGRGQLEGVLDGLFRPGSSFLPPFLPEPRRAGAIHFAGQMGLLRNTRVPSAARLEFDMRGLVLLGDPALEMRIATPPSPPAASCPD